MISEIFKRGLEYHLTSLTPPHSYACLKPGPGFSMPWWSSCVALIDKTVAVPFVNIFEIVETNQRLNFLFLTYTANCPDCFIRTVHYCKSHNHNRNEQDKTRKGGGRQKSKSQLKIDDTNSTK